VIVEGKGGFGGEFALQRPIVSNGDFVALQMEQAMGQGGRMPPPPDFDASMSMVHLKFGDQ